MEMDFEQVLDRVCTIPELVNETIIHIQKKTNNKLHVRDLVASILLFKNGIKVSSNLKISFRTFNNVIKQLFPDTRLNGGGESWDKHLLYCAGTKKCVTCQAYKTIDEFDKENCNKQKVSNLCKKCKSSKNTGYYKSNIGYWEDYLANNRPDYVYRNALRKARVLERTPKWANLEIIREIYNNAEGMHVDHIVPLMGELVCGLHVENNLQYLTPEENMSKGNKFVVD
jgi:hypothetical protein